MKLGDLLIPLNPSQFQHAVPPGLVIGVTDSKSQFNVVNIMWNNNKTYGWDHDFITKNFQVIKCDPEI
jgi:hypothetical protein